MKKIIVALFALFLLPAMSHAQYLNPWLNKNDIYGIPLGFSQAGGFGYLNSGGTPYSYLTWRPNIKIKDFGLGLDLNLPVTSDRPYDVESVVVRFAELDTQNWGIRYGVLSNVSLGQGLLMDEYTTSNQGGALLTNAQTAGQVRFDLGKIKFQGVLTRSSVVGVTLREEIAPNLTLGQTYVRDADGVRMVLPSGAVSQTPAQTGYAGDIQYSLGVAKLYAEYAKLDNFGGGFAYGAKAGQNFLFMMWQAKLEWQNFDSNFVPALFGAQYETNPANLAIAPVGGPQRQGVVADARGYLIGIAELGLTYSFYNGQNPALSARLATDFSSSYFVAARYDQPNFQSLHSISFDQGAILTAEVGFKINPVTLLTTSYKKAYDPVLGKVVESTGVSAQLVF